MARENEYRVPKMPPKLKEHLIDQCVSDIFSTFGLCVSDISKIDQALERAYKQGRNDEFHHFMTIMKNEEVTQ